MAQQAGWLAFIEQFQYSIQHRAGVRHGHTDALSRRPQNCRYCSLCKTEETRAINTQYDGSQSPHFAVAARRKSLDDSQLVQATSNDQSSGN
jgi:hypothetical protein